MILADAPYHPCRRTGDNEAGQGRLRDATTWGIFSAGRGPVQSDLAPMQTKTYFAFRVDVWDSAANSIVEHVAGIDDFEVAVATYRAAVARWPAARITLRQGARVVTKTWTE